MTQMIVGTAVSVKNNPPPNKKIWPKFRKDLPTEPSLVRMEKNTYLDRKPAGQIAPTWKSMHPFVGICMDSHRQRGGKVVFFRVGEFKEACMAGDIKPGVFIPVQLTEERAMNAEAIRYLHVYEATGARVAKGKELVSGYLDTEIYAVPDEYHAYRMMESSISRSNKKLQLLAEETHARALEDRVLNMYALSFDAAKQEIINSLAESKFNSERYDDEEDGAMVFSFVRKDGAPLEADDHSIIRSFLGNPPAEQLEFRDEAVFVVHPKKAAPTASSAAQQQQAQADKDAVRGDELRNGECSAIVAAQVKLEEDLKQNASDNYKIS